MSYTVIVDGVPILCETAAAAIALAREAANEGTSAAHSQGQSSLPLSESSRWTEQRIEDFFRFIKPQQRKLIDGLMETADARTDEQLCQLLGLADGRALAGVFTALFKNAKKAGANPRELYLRHPVTIDGKRQFEYTLADSFRAAAKRWRG